MHLCKNCWKNKATFCHCKLEKCTQIDNNIFVSTLFTYEICWRNYIEESEMGTYALFIKK